MPDKIDISKDASFKRNLAFSVPLENLTRVLDAAPGSSGCADVEIECDVNSENQPFANVKVQVALNLECQRCLERSDFPVSVSQRVMPVSTDDEAKALPEGYEPVLTEDRFANVIDMIEDEILLSIPMHPKHDVSVCEVSFEEAELKEDRQTPFTGLADLLENEQAN